MTASDLLSLYGFIVAALSLVVSIGVLMFEIWKHRDEASEKVILRLGVYREGNLADSPQLWLYIHNDSRSALYLKKAELSWNECDAIRQVRFDKPAIRHSLDGQPFIQKVGVGKHFTDGIASGNGIELMLFDLDFGRLQTITQLRNKAVWIAVFSSSGEIRRIKGKHVLPVLQHLLSFGKPKALEPAPDISMDVSNWMLSFESMGEHGHWSSEHSMGEAMHVSYGFTLKLFNLGLLPTTLRDMKIRFWQGEGILISETPAEEQPGKRAWVQLSGIDLPARETVSIVIKGEFTKNESPTLQMCDKVTLVAYTPDREERECKVADLSFSESLRQLP
jgi:hypothetical protein